MSVPKPRESKKNVNRARRRLIMLGVYSVPAVFFLGKVSGAKASGRDNREVRRSDSGGEDCSLIKQIISLGEWCD